MKDTKGVLCALLSSGKDSVYAMHRMRQQGYSIACCGTVHSQNPDSYMYHTPLTHAAALQAEAMGLPCLTVDTEGEKEEEVGALRTLLIRAKDTYNIDGVVGGALYSEYQRSRIADVCEELGLELHAPLWHMGQEKEVREVLAAGFTFVLTKVAAEGLDKGWLGRPITEKDIDVLSGKLGLNVAGEGGEYESLVLDGPGFLKRLELSGVRVECEGSGGSGDVCRLSADVRLVDKP